MGHPLFWLYWVAAFLGVIALLMAVVGLEEWWLWRREKRLAILALLLSTPALAHDVARPELNDWFNHLSSGQGLCCSLTDGETVADVDWQTVAGKFQVRLDGVWIDVPDSAVISEPNKAGVAMVWPLRGAGGVTVRCFIAGMMT